jgi:CBS domain-containing protein
MLVRDIMSSPAVTIRPDDDLAEAARLLDRLSLTTLPVVDRDLRLLGIFSEADVIGRFSRTREPDDGARVGDLMTTRVLTVDPDDEVTRVVELMRGTILKSLPVLLHDRVVGMVSRRDVVGAIARGDLDVRPIDEFSPA